MKNRQKPMMKNICTFCIIACILLTLATRCLQADTAGKEADLEKDNPINKVFDKDFNEASITMEINYVSEKYSEAWKAELKNVAERIKDRYKFKEDKQRVNDYVTAYRELAKKAFDLEMLNWSDTDEPQSTRNFGTGGLGAAVSTEAYIYKQATINLIRHYEKMSDSKYRFLYNGKGAQLDKLRNEHGQ